MTESFRYAKRDDGEGLMLEPTEDFVFRPSGILSLMKDYSSAASSAAQEVFCNGADGDFEIRIGMCHTHASLRWVSNHKPSFANAKKNACNFQKDLDYAIKDCPHVKLVGTMKHLFYKKWLKLGEREIVDAWRKVWHDVKICRVEMNQEDVNPLRGGNPADNNALESSNNSNKNNLDRTRVPVTELVDNLAKNILSLESVADTRYQSKLKNRSNHKGRNGKERFNRAIRNQDFFDGCYEETVKDEEGIGNFMNIQFKLRPAGEYEVPIGSVMILSRKGERDCLGDEDWLQRSSEKATPRDFTVFLRKAEWVDHFKMILHDPDGAVASLDLSFASLHDYLKTFYVISPIKHDPDDLTCSVNLAIRHWLEMLKLSKMPVLSFDQIMDRDPMDGLVSCTCGTYFHYMICTHTFCILKRNGIITDWINTLDPTPMRKKTGSMKKKMGAGKKSSLSKN